jgi:hypothetical protein
MPTVTLDLADRVKIRIPHGNRRTLLFRLRSDQTRNAQNVSTAESILLEWSIDGEAQAPVTALVDHPLADWETGVVPVEVTGADVLSTLGEKEFSLTGFFGTDDPKTWVTGHIDVYARPGFPYVPPA